MQLVHTSAYLFIALSDLEALKQRLYSKCETLKLKGTILLAEEGINLCLAGNGPELQTFKTYLLAEEGLANLPYKDTPADEMPYKRLKVKIKPEIITFREHGIEPGRYTSKRITPKQLKQWLDEGKRFTLLDTRNRSEISFGTFSSAVDLGIDNFRDFSKAAKQLDDGQKREPIVTFCTGGVRCEKAGPLLEQQGCQDVYQLDGGILQYFLDCGAAHYDGDCFVFDERVALAPDLTSKC